MRSIIRAGAVIPVALSFTSVAAADDYPPPREPLVSPPGWFGPGPAWGRWRNDTGPGNGWQYYGVPDGPFVTNPPPRAYPIGGAYNYWGYVPAATGSFWTNGLSLYGPPVPVYGPTPGVFGGGDEAKTFFRKPPPNGLYFGLGWGGYWSPSPRHLPLSVSVWPPAESVQVIPGPVAVTADGGAPCLRLAVRVPDAAADVWVEKKAMTQRGTDRAFESPPLEAGKVYRYELIARWTADGREHAETRTVVGRAGDTVAVDFNIPDPAAGPVLAQAPPLIPTPAGPPARLPAGVGR